MAGGLSVSAVVMRRIQAQRGRKRQRTPPKYLRKGRKTISDDGLVARGHAEGPRACCGATRSALWVRKLSLPFHLLHPSLNPLDPCPIRTTVPPARATYLTPL